MASVPRGPPAASRGSPRPTSLRPWQRMGTISRYSVPPGSTSFRCTRPGMIWRWLPPSWRPIALGSPCFARPWGAMANHVWYPSPSTRARTASVTPATSSAPRRRRRSRKTRPPTSYGPRPTRLSRPGTSRSRALVPRARRPCWTPSWLPLSRTAASGSGGINAVSTSTCARLGGLRPRICATITCTLRASTLSLSGPPTAARSRGRPSAYTARSSAPVPTCWTSRLGTRPRATSRGVQPICAPGSCYASPVPSGAGIASDRAWACVAAATSSAARRGVPATGAGATGRLLRAT